MSRTEEQKIEFIENLYPAAKRVSDQTGMAWETILAQAAQETGWGEHVLPGTNNIFNIKADSSWKGETRTFNVHEYDANGNIYYTDSKFRVYPSIDAAMEDRVKFLKENGRYADAGLFDEGVKGNLQAEANALKRAGYATDPNYAQSLVEVFNSSIMQEGIERAGGPRHNALSDNILSREERGDAVTELQQKLTAAGFSTKGVDGHYGQNTEDAVRAFQQARNLGVDGIAGPKTLEALGMQLNPAQPQPPASETPTQQQPAPQPPTAQQPAPAPANPADDRNWPTPGNYEVKVSHGGSDGLGEFGDPRSNNRGYHTGVDISGNVGDPIESFRPGRVVAVVHNDPDAGNFVWIDHGDGLQTRYLHMDTINVQEGQQVTEHTKIGTMGRTGNTPDNADTHLHFETRVNGEPVDPRQYLNFPPRDLLQNGDRGKDVQDLQNALIRNGAKIEADGEFGAGTKAAVEAFQARQGLKVDGMAGPETQKALGVTHEQAPASPAPAQPTPQPGTPNAPAANDPTLADNMLRRNEEGPAVRKLQEDLTRAGFPTQGVDGKFGQNTEDAVKRYQESRGLQVDGIAGPLTLAALSAQQQAPSSLPNAQQPTQPNAPQPPANAQPTHPDAPPPANAQPTQPNAPQPPANAQPTPAEKPPISNSTHPDNKLYQQAMSNLEQLGPSGGFRTREQLEMAAAAVAADAKATGLHSIDHISRTTAPNGQNLLVAVQGDPTNPASKSSYIDYGQAVTQTVAQSTAMAEGQKPAAQPAAAQPAPQQEPMMEPVRISATR